VLRQLKHLAEKAEAASSLDSPFRDEGSGARVYFSEFAGMLKTEEGAGREHKGGAPGLWL